MNTNFLRDKIHQFKKLNCIQSGKLPYDVDTLGICQKHKAKFKKTLETSQTYIFVS